jgi:uncharacterized protein with GYD domain
MIPGDMPVHVEQKLDAGAYPQRRYMEHVTIGGCPVTGVERADPASVRKAKFLVPGETRNYCSAIQLGVYNLPYPRAGGEAMPKYLVQGSYTDQGLKGLLKEGGSKRRAVVEQLAHHMGGKLEAFYYAFGSDDFVIILDLPSNIDMAATAIVAQASGMVKSRVTVLMAPEDVDQAVQRKVDFRPPE